MKGRRASDTSTLEVQEDRLILCESSGIQLSHNRYEIAATTRELISRGSLLRVSIRGFYLEPGSRWLLYPCIATGTHDLWQP